MSTFDLPPTLIEAVRSGRVVLFLGAGASLEAKDAERHAAPSTSKLAQEIALKFLGKKLEKFDLQTISEMAAQSVTSSVVFEYIRDRLRKLEPSKAHMMIPSFQWHTIATTNYDTLIEDSYGRSTHSPQELVRFVKDGEPIETKMMNAINPLQFLKLHGCIEHVHDPDIPLVLDASHYERYIVNRTKLFSRLENIADELPFLFIGYSLADSHIANLIHRLERAGRRPEYFVVSPGVEPEIKKLWSGRRITVIDAKFGQFMDALDRAIPQMWRQLKPGSLGAELPIRKHFRVHADPSELLISTLSSDLLHIHPNLPMKEQDPQRFYRGYDTGFAAISDNLDVSRKVSDDVIYSAAEAVNTNNQSLMLLAGAGGSGKTIVLKRVIWELAVSLDMLCLWHTRLGAIRADAIRELYDLTGKPIVLAVDNIASHLNEISQLFKELFLHNVPIVVLGAERISTWNTESHDFEERWPVQWFRIGQLLPSEVDQLLDKLHDHSALGVLAHLSRQEQLEAFANADRHLLVALHELTSGEPFEKIVVDEFKSISPPKAQQLYLDICTLNQFAVPARAGAIKRITSIPFSQYEREFFEPLEGVVLADPNKYTGDYEYRARHSKVAQLVFKHTMPEDSARVQHLVRFLESLDVGYSSDRDALFHIIRARNLLSLVTSIDWGREFYDVATKRMPVDGYVWQHRAIYELRHKDGDLEKAEDYASHAAALDSKNKSFRHTLAEIARERARRATNSAQKRLFRQQSYSRLASISDGKNTFADYTRCKLKLDELRETAKDLIEGDEDSEARLNEAMRDAQETIDRALDRHPLDADIVRLEADLLSLLNDHGRALLALERAWRLGAQGTGIAIQLSKIYSATGATTKSKEIVAEALERVPHDQAANLRMAKLIVADGGDVHRAILHVSRSYSLVDRNYDARFLHAQLLFLAGDGTAAERLFKEVDRLAPAGHLPRSQVNKTHVSNLVGVLPARVARREQSYVFVETDRYPENIFVHISDCPNADWTNVRSNTPVQLGIAFNRRGPVGFDLMIRN